MRNGNPWMVANPLRSRHKSKRSGTSLLEVMGATVCATLLLVPTATMLSDSHRWSGRIEQQAELSNLVDSCISQIEFELASNFRSGQRNDSFSSLGVPHSRYTATWSDSVARGGIPGRFVSLDVTAWVDMNRNQQYDVGEPRHLVSTGLARRR
jgi:type II secretory pathway component PulJ